MTAVIDMAFLNTFESKRVKQRATRKSKVGNDRVNGKLAELDVEHFGGKQHLSIWRLHVMGLRFMSI